jgi:hypothetical protein
MLRVNPQHATANLVYYNAALFAPSDGKIVEAAISDTRSEPIVGRPEDFECSIIRFDISASLLPPIVVPMPQPPLLGTTPSNLLATLSYLGVDYQEPLLFAVASVETSGFVYAIDELINSLNFAFGLAYVNLIAAVGAIAGITNAPVFAFDPVTQLISLYLETAWAGSGVTIWTNSQLYQYIVSFLANFSGYNNLNGKDFELREYTISAKLLPAPGARVGYPSLLNAIANPLIQLSQTAPSLGSMNGVRSIYITTSMPIDSEALPTSITPGQSANNSTNKDKIMSDFLIATEPATNPVQDRISVSYLPQAEYRMIQMRGTQPLYLIDLKWWYTLQDGTKREMLIPPGGSANAKLLFRRKRAEDLLSH